MDNIFNFEERTGAWWFFTLLPLGIVILLSIIIVSINLGSLIIAIMFLTSNLLFYSLILSSTDIHLRAVIKEDIYQPLAVVIISALFLLLLVIEEKVIPLFNNSFFGRNPFIIVMFVIAIIVCFASIKLYNKNPRTKDIYEPKDFMDQKQKSEEKSGNKIKSTKNLTTKDKRLLGLK